MRVLIARHTQNARAEQGLRRGLEVGRDHHLGVGLGEDRHGPGKAQQSRLTRSHVHKPQITAAPELELAINIRQFAATLSGPQRVAGLGHEVRDDPVELQPVIEALVGQGADTLDRQGCHPRLKLDQDAALGRVDDEQVLGRDGPPFRRRRLGHDRA